jgi:hypothetical protein
MKTGSGFTSREECRAYMELYLQKVDESENKKNRTDFLNLLKGMGRLIPVEQGDRVVVLYQEGCPDCRPHGGPGCHRVQHMNSLSVFYAMGFDLDKCERK